MKYYEADLKEMTTYQLQEIARREKVIAAVVNRLDKELLIRTIMEYRGAENALLINSYNEEAYKKLEEAIPQINFQPREKHITFPARIEVWQGLSTNYFDGLMIDYQEELSGTNAFIVNSDRELCCVLNVEEKPGDEKNLYLRRNREFPARETEIKNYWLILLSRKYSEQFWKYYSGQTDQLVPNMPAYCLQLLDFRVTKPEILKMPVAIDFGTSSTTAGVMELLTEKIRYATFYDGGQETNQLPSIIGIISLEDAQNPKLAFGYEALKLKGSRTIFYDVKRWVGNYRRPIELIDGHKDDDNLFRAKNY